MAAIFLKFARIVPKITFRGVFGVADYKSESSLKKNKMADPKWQKFFLIYSDFNGKHSWKVSWVAYYVSEVSLKKKNGIQDGDI